MLTVYSKNMKRAILVHGWDGRIDKNWFPWLQNELFELGYFVQPITMPNPASPDKLSWVKHLKNHISIDKKTIIIAHSLGCIAIIRYLESTKEVPKGILFVAPFVENVGNWKTVESFFRGNINWKHLSKCNVSTLHSDNDPYVPKEQRFLFKEKCEATCYVEHGVGHFDGNKYSKILQIIKNL